MEKRIFLTVLSLSLAALLLALLLPGGRDQGPPRLPWQVEVDSDGRSSVFGITLGVTPLDEARELFRDSGVTSLFVSPTGEYAVEVYFKALYLSGIKADLVLVLALAQAEMAEMYERGLRISKLESGNRKVRLAEVDAARLSSVPVNRITYIPGTDLERSLVASRFGEPAQRISEASGIEHWLYPEKGLDIAINPKGKEVMQYLLPSQFDRVVEPLRGAAPVSGQQHPVPAGEGG